MVISFYKRDFKSINKTITHGKSIMPLDKLKKKHFYHCISKCN